jgi:hypothetical protein
MDLRQLSALYQGNSSVGIARLGHESAAFGSSKGQETVSSPQRLDQFWGPASLLSIGTGGSFPEGKAAGECG